MNNSSCNNIIIYRKILYVCLFAIILLSILIMVMLYHKNRYTDTVIIRSDNIKNNNTQNIMVKELELEYTFESGYTYKMTDIGIDLSLLPLLSETNIHIFTWTYDRNTIYDRSKYIFYYDDIEIGRGMNGISNHIHNIPKHENHILRIRYPWFKTDFYDPHDECQVSLYMDNYFIIGFNIISYFQYLGYTVEIEKIYYDKKDNIIKSIIDRIPFRKHKEPPNIRPSIIVGTGITLPPSMSSTGITESPQPEQLPKTDSGIEGEKDGENEKH